VSGLHEFLCDDAELSAAAKRCGAALRDVRRNNERDVAQRAGIDEQCLRIHTVGHDCSCGKMLTAIEVTRGLKSRGVDAKFVATGQTGIMIEGDGCPIDCVVADFINGAAERLVLAHQHHAMMVIEGQGSLAHPRYSSVTLGLLHGALPHALIMCFELGRTEVRGMPGIGLRPIGELIELYERCAAVMQPTKVIGLAVHSGRYDDAAWASERARLEAEHGLPVCDVIRDGAAALVEAVVQFEASRAATAQKG